VSLLGKHVLPRPMASDLRAVHRRASVVGLAIVAALAGIGFKAARVALDQHEAYAEQANRQQLRSYKLPASRGEVVDRDFMTLAINDRVHKVVLNPRFIRAQGRDEDVVAALLTLFPDEDPAYLRDELAKDKAYRQLRMTLSDAQADELAKQLGLPGVSLEPASERVYPRGLLAAHVLGRVSGQGGTAGVELGMDEALRGRDALSPAYFAAGKKLLSTASPTPASPAATPWC
jgi:cell division protein FtsI (penicillin-binding protein 3)